MFEDDPKEPWHIVADEIGYDDKENRYVAKGNVTITKQGKRLSADYVRFDQKTMQAFAEGHVIMTAGEDVLVGNRMEMDLAAETGTIYDGTIFIKENHYYIKGDKIQKLGKDTYAAEKAIITTCDGELPAWKITGRKLKITIEGYGYVNHAALWVKKAPVLYTPFLVFPVKLKRQSGLLAPRIGYSDRKGEEYIQPLYWAIDESSDATFYLHHMGRRGEKLGLEYRYVWDNRSKGTLMYDFLDDKKVDDGSPGSSDWGYDDDDLLRPNSDRYWFRMKHSQALPHDFFAKLDLDIVSDQDYLREFRYGYTGFEETKHYFNKSFNRDIDEYDDYIRTNKLNVNRIWSAFSFNAELLWNDNVVSRRQEDTDDTLQRLPFIAFDGAKQKMLTSPFYFDLDSEYTYFYSEDGERGHRIDAHPRLYLPLHLRNYFNFEPSIGMRGTIWHFDKQKYSPRNDKTLDRTIHDIKLDLSSDIHKIYPGIGDGVDRIKHIVRPQVVYDYIPDKDQDEFPSFDDLDRIDRENLLTYSITNTFISRVKKGVKKKDGSLEKNVTPVNYTYKQLGRFKIQQSFDINKERDDDPEPFSPILAELEVTPGKYFSIDAEAAWSTYDNRFRSGNTALTLWDKRGDRIFVEYRYMAREIESIYTDIRIKLTDSLTVHTDYERNILEDEDVRYRAGVLYQSQCWSLDFRYTDEDNDRRYELMVNLSGLGEVGEGISVQ